MDIHTPGFRLLVQSSSIDGEPAVGGSNIGVDGGDAAGLAALVEVEGEGLDGGGG